MKRQFIVTAPIERRRHEFENTFWDDNLNTEKVTKIMYDNPDFQLWDLQDLVVYCNDQAFDVDGVWMEAITVEVPDNYNPNASAWYQDLVRF